MKDDALPDVQFRHRAKFSLFCIILVALLVRLIHFWALTQSTLPFRHTAVTVTDDYAFVQWAESIRAGDWLGRETYHPYFPWMQEIAPLESWYHWWGGREIFHQSPLYPYLLAALLTVTAGSFPMVLLVQLLIGALQPLVMYHLARRVWDVRVGLVAAAITALYGPFIFYEGVFLRDWLLPLLGPLALLAVLCAMERDSSQRWMVAGMTLGLALLAKETATLLVLLALCWPLVGYRSRLQRGVRAIGWMMFGLVLVLSPVLLRNATVNAPVFALSNRAAEGIIEGWAADGYPVGMYLPLSMKEILLRSDGRLSGVIQSTLDTYRGDWDQLFRHIVLKLRGISDPFEFPNNVSFYYGLDISPILRFTLGYGFVFPLGVAGFIMCLNTWRQHALAAAYTVAASAGLLATVVLARYRLELVSGLILYAAAFVGQLLDATRQRHIRRVIVGVVLAALVTFLQQLVLPLGAEVKDYAFTTDYSASAAIHATRHQFNRAVDDMNRALKKTSEHPEFHILLTGADGTTRSYFNDVRFLMMQQRFYRAQQLLEEHAITAAWREAELVREILLQFARSDTNRLYALAHLYLRLNDTTRAGELLDTILEVDPNGPFAADAQRLLSVLHDSGQKQP